MKQKIFAQVGWVLAACLFFGACSGPIQRGEEGAESESALLIIEAQPEDPVVVVDSVFRGKVSRWRDHTIPVPPGEHRLELLHEGFYPYRNDLTLKPGHIYTLRVRMVRHHEP